MGVLVHTFFRRKEMMGTIFDFFQRNPSYSMESLLGGFFWTIAIQFSRSSGDHLFHNSPSSGMDSLDELPKVALSSRQFIWRSGVCIALWVGT